MILYAPGLMVRYFTVKVSFPLSLVVISALSGPETSTDRHTEEMRGKMKRRGW